VDRVGDVLRNGRQPFGVLSEPEDELSHPLLRSHPGGPITRSPPQLVRQINDLARRGASRVVVSVGGGEEGASIEARLKRLLLRLYPRHLLSAIPLLFSWELAADRDDVRRTRRPWRDAHAPGSRCARCSPMRGPATRSALDSRANES
jgi:hypothetical protein